MFLVSISTANQRVSHITHSALVLRLIKYYIVNIQR